MPRKLTFQKVREMAFRGEVESAIAAFQVLAAAGDLGAILSLANIAALRGLADECLAWAAQAMKAGSLGYPQAGFDDAVYLLGWAGRRTGRWEDIARTCLDSLQSLQANNSVAGERNARVLDSLLAYARRCGAPPHELVAIFSTPWPDPDPLVRRHLYEQALAKVHTLRPDLVGDPEALAGHRHGLARLFGQDEEAVREFFSHPRPDACFYFRDALHTARVLARNGEPDRAWELVRTWLPRWFPENAWARIAPIELLIEPELEPLVTRERGEEILRCPRATQTPEERHRLDRERERRQAAKLLPKVPVLRVRSFAKAPSPVSEPVAKFGGQPVWMGEPQWPVGRTRGLPMTFVGQIPLDTKIFGGQPGRVAYLFVDEGTEERPTAFFMANGGDNAVVILPDGDCPVPTLPLTTGPMLCEDEYLPRVKWSEDPPLPGTIDDSARTIEKLGGNKIGGTPLFLDHEEYPDNGGVWRLVLQLSDDTPFGLNCCLGMGYIFITEDGWRGAFFCQSG